MKREASALTFDLRYRAFPQRLCLGGERLLHHKDVKRGPHTTKALEASFVVAFAKSLLW